MYIFFQVLLKLFGSTIMKSKKEQSYQFPDDINDWSIMNSAKKTR